MTEPVGGHILHGPSQPGEVLGLMDHLDLVVGMRLHFLSFAAMKGVPFLPVPYAGKVFDFACATGVWPAITPGPCWRTSTGCGTNAPSAWAFCGSGGRR